MQPKKLIARNRAIRPVMFMFCLALADPAFARVGGAGGHSSHSSSSGSGGGGGGFFFFTDSPVLNFLIIAIVVIYYIVKYLNKQSNNNETNSAAVPMTNAVPFPGGLDEEKVASSFLAIQDAWQRKDLKNVRKWLSDGMYQRLTTQFKMMNALGQSNVLSNISIERITAADTNTEGNYQTAEVAISFTMNDSFVCSKFPSLNESYQGDSDTEFWTFIKRTDAPNEKNLYDNNNCPNCGAPFEVKMGEISRCSNCNTLTNSAAYDWVLSEITQQDDYTGGAGMSNEQALATLMAGDPFFSAQRMEDIASNVFMQIMEVLSISDKKKLTRFADEPTVDAVMKYKQGLKPFVFDRLYLNSATLDNCDVAGDVVKLHFDLRCTYRRVSTEGRLQILDNDFVTTSFALELSRNKIVAQKAEFVYSHECSSCGAPYTDTTDDHCTYCDAPVIDIKKNWVLTGVTLG